MEGGETRELLYAHLYSLVKTFLMDQILVSSLSRNPSSSNVRLLIDNTHKVRNIEEMIETRIYKEEIKTQREINRDFWFYTNSLQRPKDTEEGEI